MLDSIKKVGLFLARTDIFFYALFWLMVLVVAGTLSQGAIGLYQAQMKFFSSFVLWVGYIPTPGGYTTMGVVLIGIVCKLIFKSQWNKRSLGVNIVHLGAFLLLFGGLLTAVLSSEGSLMMAEGETTNVVHDYHHVELAIQKKLGGQKLKTYAFSQGFLEDGEVLKHEDLNFSLHIEAFYPNVKFQKIDKPVGDLDKGFLKQFNMIEVAREKVNEENRSGIIFKVFNSQHKAIGRYAVFEDMPITQTLKGFDDNVQIVLRHEKRFLPFTLTLQDFEKKTYPGTMKAKSFKSVAILNDGDSKQRVVIQMNEPLRYKDYTLFQASFVEGAQAETTVLAVVKNAGRIFPYLSSLIMCAGLLIHLLMMIPELLKKREVQV